MTQSATSPELSVISDPSTGHEALLDAIRNLGPAGEPPDFWSKIANGERYTPAHRRQAIFELFRRHVRAPITIADLSRLLAHPTWLRDEDLEVVDRLGGKIPVRFTPEDTIFVLAVFPGISGDRFARWAIYLRVGGKVDRRELLAALGDPSPAGAASAARLLEYGLSPGDPTAAR